MEIKFTCKYCNYKWVKKMYNYENSTSIKCPMCSDKSIIAKEVDNGSKVDYYAGAPAFPEKIEEKKDPVNYDNTITWRLE